MQRSKRFQRNLRYRKAQPSLCRGAVLCCAMLRGRGRDGLCAALSCFQKSPSFDTKVAQAATEIEDDPVVEQLATTKPQDMPYATPACPAGASWRSALLTTPVMTPCVSNRAHKKVAGVLTELGIPAKPMATAVRAHTYVGAACAASHTRGEGLAWLVAQRVVEEHARLRQEVLLMLSLHKLVRKRQRQATGLLDQRSKLAITGPQPVLHAMTNSRIAAQQGTAPGMVVWTVLECGQATERLLGCKFIMPTFLFLCFFFFFFFLSSRRATAATERAKLAAQRLAAQAKAKHAAAAAVAQAQAATAMQQRPQPAATTTKTTSKSRSKASRASQSAKAKAAQARVAAARVAQQNLRAKNAALAAQGGGKGLVPSARGVTAVGMGKGKGTLPGPRVRFGVLAVCLGCWELACVSRSDVPVPVVLRNDESRSLEGATRSEHASRSRGCV